MSVTLSPAEELAAGRGRTVAHWAGLTALLAVESLALLLVCQGGALLTDRAWWGGFAGQTKILSWLATSTLTGLVIFGTAQLRQPRFGLVERLRRPRLSWPLLGCHLAGFLLFAELTRAITSRDLQHSPEYAEPLLLLWAGAGLFSLLCWLAAALPGTGAGVALASAVAGLVAWLGGGGTLRLWGVLKYATFATAHGLLRLVFHEHDIICDPGTEKLGALRFDVIVGPGCSGCEGIGLICVCLGLYLWCFRHELRWPRALLLLPLGVALVWAANGVRLASLVALGALASPDMAMGGFHSQAGWLTFNGIALGLMAVAQRGRYFTGREPEDEEAGPADNAVAPYLGPLLALVAVTMITSALSDGFDGLYPLRLAVVAATLGLYWPHYAGWRFGWSWPAAGLGVAAFAVWMGLEFVRGAPEDTGLRSGLAALPAGWAAAWVVCRVVGSVVTVPIAEELGFRGYLLRRLVAADFRAVTPERITWAAVLISSALFGMLHGRWLAGLLAGVLYALALKRRGRVADAVLAHAVTNGLIAAYVLATGTWSLWC